MKRSKPLESLILTIRAHKVMIDADLAELYGVETRTLWQHGKLFLIPVFVDIDPRPAEVVTAYRTSKIEKYWRKP